jgi:toxin ParE1/3/4
VTPLRLSPAAEADLSDIWDFTAEQWDSRQADRYVRMIVERAQGAAEGRLPMRLADNIRSGYTKIAAGSHMIYFRPTGGEVEVVRILHQSMDVDSKLGS